MIIQKRILTAFIMFLSVLTLNAQQNDNSDILEQAEKNIEQYRKADASLTFTDKEGNPIAATDIVIEQTSQDFLFGNIIFPVVGVLGKFEDIDVYRPELFKKRFKDLFNMAIMPYYWSSYEREPGKEKYDRIDPILDWCELNGITPKGHPLAWVERGGTPTWLYDLPVPLTKDLLKARITRLVKGYQGRIDTWDVVNEPTHTVSWDTVIVKPYEMRYKARPIDEIADWIENCYRWAYDANPEADLVINEYETIVADFILNTRERFYELIAELQKRGTPVTGVGLQAHEPRSEWYDPGVYWETLDYYSQLGLPLHLTEFTAESSNEKINGRDDETWTLEAQADYAEQFYRLSFGHPSVKSINWWGLSDRYIWNERPQAGLIDENYSPKPVYTRLMKLIKGEWMTNTSGKTDGGGAYNFRGFFGNYKVTLKTEDGRHQAFEIHVGADEENKWKFSL